METAMRGRKPTPTAILKARGSWRAKTRKREPNPDKGRPRVPSFLKGTAKTEWLKLVEMLERMSILTKIDGNALARYCRLWQRWREAEEFLRKKGSDQYEVKDGKGRVVSYRMYPMAKSAATLAVELRRLEQEFGLTPSSRTRISQEATAAGSAVAEPHKARFFKAGA